MPERSIRFAVGDGTSCRAQIWKCWTPGSDKRDVYLAARSLGYAFKVSLHESGKWHIGFGRDFLAENGSHEEWPSRIVASWERPREVAPGVTLAFRIITPASSACMPVVDTVVGKKEIAWHPPVELPSAVEFDLVMTAPSTVVSGWPGRRSMDTKLMGKFVLVDRSTVWVVARETPMVFPSMPAGRPRYFQGRSREDFNGAGLRGLALKREADGSRTYLDLAGSAQGTDTVA